MLKKESQAGTKAEQRKNDEGLTSSPACTKPNVVCSQSPPIYNSITFVESSSIFQVLYEETKLCVLETGQVVVHL